MMVMTAKVDLKKIVFVIAAVVVLLLAAIGLLGGNKNAAPTAAPSVSSNDGRVQFLKGFGWDVTTSPTESSQVKIPKKSSAVFDRYNVLQKGQGYDLSKYAGKSVMRYVYKINNYPGATEPVYATLLVHKDKIIGGDVTNTAAGGKMQGFQMPTSETAPARLPSESTVPESNPS
ncbi:MAG: DUF4830 domain-containing protein [Faecousia sp.]